LNIITLANRFAYTGTTEKTHNPTGQAIEMTTLENPGTNIDPITIKWIKIIALWTLITAVLNLLFYGLVQSSLVKGTFTLLDHLDVLINSVLGLLTFWGLWRHAAWGWKIAVIAIPFSWVYGVYSISLNYQPGMGAVTSTFLFIDAAIFIFLFTPTVRNFFHIISFWPSLEWVKYPLLVTAVFLMALDFVGNLGGVIAAFSAFVPMMLWNRYRHGNPDQRE
jgi:hypothetical protein